MSEKPTFSVATRDDSGKGVARKLRAAGKIPAVVYGANDAIALTADPKELYELLTGPFRTNVIFRLAIEGGESHEYVMVREYQVDPVRRDLLHADFLVVDPATPLKVTVPVETTGRAKGVREGGKLRAVRPEVTISARPDDIPVSIVHDVTEVGLTEVVLASQLTLPDGVAPAYKRDYSVFQVAILRGAEEEVEEEGAAAEGAESAEA